MLAYNTTLDFNFGQEYVSKPKSSAADMCTADQVRAGLVNQSTFHEWCHSTISTQTTLLALPLSIGLFDMDNGSGRPDPPIHVPDPDKFLFRSGLPDPDMFMLALTLYIAVVALGVVALVKLISSVTDRCLYIFCPYGELLNMYIV